ncbi:MAG: hypothetical protein GY927_04555 [bacterium]|nr:hypothetical protein [bacterium]
MFKLHTLPGDANGQRLIASDAMTPESFDELAKMLNIPIVQARKIGFVAAQQSQKEQFVETLWNGKESQITAQIGDWVVTNLTPNLSVLRDKDGNANIYAIRADKFSSFYKRHEGANSFGDIYRAISQVDCLYLSGGFEIMAPWGEVQLADQGYLLRNGSDIYGNHKDTFDATYEKMVG